MSSRSKNKSFRFQTSHSRFFLLRCAVVFAFSLLAVRLVYVQGVLRSDLKKRADRQYSSKLNTAHQRGRLLDINKQVLSETVPVYSCFIDPSLIKNKAQVAKILAAALSMNEKKLTEKIKKARGSFLWIERNISPIAMARIQEGDVPGIGFKTEFRRNYPMGPMASHLLGLVGYEGRGLSGIEQNFEKVLGAGVEKQDVQLTIDASIQKVVERELNWGVEKTGAKKGFVIVQNPWTGEIIAAASWPPVSLSPDSPPHPDELRVPFMVDVFEPGSTYKVVTAAATIEEKLMKEKETFDGEKGKWTVYNITINDHEPLKKMTFDDIMVYSSNIGTSKLADRIGTERLFQYSRLFGFGAYPASGLSGEAKGTLRPPSKWSGVSKYAVSFGQEVGVTALQLAGAYSAIANGGTLLEPRFVHAILSPDGDVVEEKRTSRVRRVMSPDTAEKLKNLLAKVVEKGTGINAQIQWDTSVRVAGKTGTAQKFNIQKKRYDEHLTLVSFCGFFPVENPEYTMVVILDEPEGRRWGGLDAAPVFRRIAETLSPRLTKTPKQLAGV